MTVALRSSVTCSPSCSTAASLERTLPPAWPSVVEEAMSSCSAAMRRKNALERGIALGVAHDARHLDLVHGVDQRGRGAGLTEDVAHVGDFRDARAFAAERLRHLNAEQPLPAISANASPGKRASASTAAAFAFATSAAARARAVRSFWRTLTTRAAARHPLRFHSKFPNDPLGYGNSQGIMRRVPGRTTAN